jgi:hypothetical protein
MPSVIMLSVILLSVIMLSVDVLNVVKHIVIMKSVVAPSSNTINLQPYATRCLCNGNTVANINCTLVCFCSKVAAVNSS